MDNITPAPVRHLWAFPLLAMLCIGCGACSQSTQNDQRVPYLIRCLEIPVDVEVVNCLASSIDGRYLAAGFSDNRLAIWDRDSQYQMQLHGQANTIQLGCQSGPMGIQSVAFSEKGNLLVVGSWNDGNIVRVYDVPENRIWRTLRIPDDCEPDAVAISADGRLVAAGGVVFTQDTEGRNFKPRVYVWDAVAEKLIAKFDEHTAPPDHEYPSLRQLVFSSDGKWLASCGLDGLIALCNLEEPRRAQLTIGVSCLPHYFPTTPRQVCFLERATRLAVLTDQSAMFVYDMSGNIDYMSGSIITLPSEPEVWKSNLFHPQTGLLFGWSGIADQVLESWDVNAKVRVKAVTVKDPAPQPGHRPPRWTVTGSGRIGRNSRCMMVSQGELLGWVANYEMGDIECWWLGKFPASAAGK